MVGGCLLGLDFREYKKATVSSAFLSCQEGIRLPGECFLRKNPLVAYTYFTGLATN